MIINKSHQKTTDNREQTVERQQNRLELRRLCVQMLINKVQQTTDTKQRTEKKTGRLNSIYLASFTI